jgi:hypothetical protein
MAEVARFASTSRGEQLGQVMQDYLISFERLQRDAAEAALIHNRASFDKAALYHRLYQHYAILAADVEKL